MVGKTLITYTIALLAIVGAFVVPWHSPEGAEWDDGEHVWGRNVHTTSLLVYELDADVAQDDTGMTLRQAGFWAVSGGTFLVFMAALFTVADRKAWTLSLGWLGFLAIGGGGTATTLGILKEVALDAFSYGFGFSALGTALLTLFIANVRASFLGKTNAAQRRKHAAMVRKDAKRTARHAKSTKSSAA